MIKRTIEVSGPDTHLSIRNAQVIVQRNGEQIGQVPAEDIGMLIIDSPTTVYTHGTLVELLEHGAAVLLCGANHLPSGQVIPLAANYLQTEPHGRAGHRAAAAQEKPVAADRAGQEFATRRGIFRPTMRCARGCSGSCRVCGRATPRTTRRTLRATTGRPGWGASTSFTATAKGRPPNNLLNYGYAVLRAATARALAGAGLHPSISLQHHSRY